MNIRRFALLPLAASVVLAAGCGKKEEPTTPTGTAPNTVSEATAKPGWKEVKSAGFTVSVPPEWTPMDLSAGDIDRIFDEAAKANEGIAKMSAQLKPMASSGMIKLMVFAPTDKATGFTENMNVVVTPQPGSPTADQLKSAYESQIRPMTVSGSEIEGGPATIPAGSGVKMVSSLNMQAGAMKSVTSIAYMFTNGGNLYTVTFSANPDNRAGMEKTAEEIMQTFKIG